MVLISTDRTGSKRPAISEEDVTAIVVRHVVRLTGGGAHMTQMGGVTDQRMYLDFSGLLAVEPF